MIESDTQHFEDDPTGHPVAPKDILPWFKTNGPMNVGYLVDPEGLPDPLYGPFLDDLQPKITPPESSGNKIQGQTLFELPIPLDPDTSLKPHEHVIADRIVQDYIALALEDQQKNAAENQEATTSLDIPQSRRSQWRETAVNFYNKLSPTRKTSQPSGVAD